MQCDKLHAVFFSTHRLRNQESGGGGGVLHTPPFKKKNRRDISIQTNDRKFLAGFSQINLLRCCRRRTNACLKMELFWHHPNVLLSWISRFFIAKGWGFFHSFFLFNYNTKIYTISRLLGFNLRDSKQSLGQRCVMVGVVGNTSLLAFWHLSIIGPSFNSWRIVVGQTLSLQLRTNSDFWVIAQHMLANCNRVIFLNIIDIFITGLQKL